MFCYQCGAKLPDGARFCPMCGVETIVATNSTQKQDIENTIEDTIEDTEKIMIPLLGQIIYLDSSLDFYVALRQAFAKLGDDIAKKFSDTFFSEYRDMDMFVRGFQKAFPEMFRKATDSMNEVLSEMDIFGVTQDELSPYLEKYCYRTVLEFQEIMEQYNKIVGQQEEMRQYRQDRKDSRGRMVGGGFGWSGAVKGMAKAGAFNMATGALHSFGNAIGNLGSSISAENAKDRLFKSGIKARLSNAIKEDILGVHLVTIDIIGTHKGKKLLKYTIEDEQQANKIWTDLEQGKIPHDRERAATIRMLTTYPFQANYYRTAVKLFPAEIEDMREFADLFEFDIDDFYFEMIERADPAVEILLEYQTEWESLLVDDLDYPEEDIKPLTTNLTAMMDYFDHIFTWAGEDGFFFLPNEHEKGKSRLDGAKSSYANYGKETPLLLYDSTISGNGKKGFIITDQNVYFKYTKAVKLPLCDALENIFQEENLSNHCEYLFFDEYEIYLLQAGSIIKEEILGDFIEFFIALILFLTTIRPAAEEESLWKAVAQYQKLPEPQKQPEPPEPQKLPQPESQKQPEPPEPQKLPQPESQKQPEPSEPQKLPQPEPQKQPKPPESQKLPQQSQARRPDAGICFCFECGAENDAEDKFCCECGAELF